MIRHLKILPSPKFAVNSQPQVRDLQELGTQHPKIRHYLGQDYQLWTHNGAIDAKIATIL
ncbi:MAG: hypothetical protein ACI875_001789 [Planctomycetota bacterium]|jgi:hypothetical protein